MLKIAVNGLGIRGNNNEIRLTNLFNKHNVQGIIAKVTDTYEDNVGTKMQYASDVKTLTMDQAKHVKDVCNDKLKSLKVPVKVVDVHDTNIGLINNQVVIIDYGSIIKN